MNIAVFGSASDYGKEQEQVANELGKEIARHGAVLVTGGCGGLPQAAALGAVKAGGHTIGYSPGHDLKEHTELHKFPTEGFGALMFLPEGLPHDDDIYACRKYRNVVSCAVCDAGIIISGRIGTLNEFTNLYDMGKVIGVLAGSKGVADLLPDLLKKLPKKTPATIVFDTEPKKLVEKVAKAIGERYELLAKAKRSN
jgi:predicted Rossmann-fold nucleotide-binding protein